MQIVSKRDNLHGLSVPVFLGKKKNIIDLSSAEFAHSMVSVKGLITTTADDILIFF